MVKPSLRSPVRLARNRPPKMARANSGAWWFDMMTTGPKGRELIKGFEGLELEAYMDLAGVWTIGYGHTSQAGPPAVVPDMVITEAEADAILRTDLQVFERRVNGAVAVPITQTMFDALVSLTYNIGASAFLRSTVLRKLNEGQYEEAADAFEMWSKARSPKTGKLEFVAGLKRRRVAEAALFLSEISQIREQCLALPHGMEIEEMSFEELMS